MLAIGFYIIYMLIGASTPGTNYYLIMGWPIGVAASLLTLGAWILIFNAIGVLERSYEELLFQWAKWVSAIGIILYVIYNIVIILGYLLPESGLNNYVNGRGIFYAYGDGYVWLQRSILFMSATVYIFRIVLGVILVMGFHRSLLAKYIRVNAISVINELVCVFVVILHACPIMMLIYEDETGAIVFYVIYKLLHVAFCIYIYSLNRKVDIHMDFSNGSVFNRIPEEEYQDFLNKMKN